MDVFEEELLAFWDALNKNNVRYIMIGGLLQDFMVTTEQPMI